MFCGRYSKPGLHCCSRHSSGRAARLSFSALRSSGWRPGARICSRPNVRPPSVFAATSSARQRLLRGDLADLRADAPLAVHRRAPAYEAEYARRGWKMVPSFDRVYVNEQARDELGWRPRYDFKFLVDRLRADEDVRSPLAQLVGSKGYHAENFAKGPYPAE